MNEENNGNNEVIEEVGEIATGNEGIKISDDVVSVVAGVAVSEVSGVAGMAGGFAGGISEVLSGKKNLSKGIKEGKKFQTLLGVTGSGKTFTMANIIQKVQKPTLVLAHNKTLARSVVFGIQRILPRE